MLGHHSGNDIGSARAAVVGKSHSYTYTTEDGSYYNVHERLLLNHRLREERLKQTYEQRDAGGSENGTDYKLFSHGPEGHSEQEEVHGVGCDCNRDDIAEQPLGNEIDQGAETGQTAHHHFFGKNKRRKAEGIKKNTERDKHVIAR